MKVLLITSDYSPRIGGISYFAEKIAVNLFKRGNNVYIISPRYGNEKDPRQNNYHIYRYKKYSRLYSLVPNIIAVWLIITKGIDIVILCHSTSSLGLGSLICKMLGLVKLSCLYHGLDIKIKDISYIDRVISKYIFYSLDVVLVNSTYTGNIIKSEYSNKKCNLHVINPGVDICECNQFDHYNRNSVYLLTIARLEERKGIDDIIKAFKFINNRYPNIELHIVGDGPQKMNLIDLAKEQNLDNKVKFMGSLTRDKVLTEIANCSFFVLAPKLLDKYNYEGFGIVYLEANAFEKPVIGTKHGGVPDAIEDGKTGILVEPGNIQQLADTMLMLINNKEMRERLGKAGQKRVYEKFTWDKIARRIEWYLSNR